MKTIYGKKVISVVLSIMMLVCIAPTFAFAQDNSSDLVPIIDERLSLQEKSTFSDLDEAWLAEAPAEEQYNTLLDSLSSPLNSDIMPASTNNGATVTLEDYYGGAFLNSENELVVYVTTSNESLISAFSDASNGAIIIPAEFTLNQLNDAYAELTATISDLNSQAAHASMLDADGSVNYLSDIRGWTLYQHRNRIVVKINQLNEDKKAFFLSLFDDISPDMFVFVESSGVTPTETIRPGSQLWSSSTISPSFNQSAGFRGYRINASGTRIYGFTAAGHGPKNALYRNGTKVGTLYDFVYTGSYDSAFYDRTSNTTLTNQTAYSNSEGGDDSVVTLSTSSSLPSLEGKTIAKVGGKTFYTTGTVLSVNDSWVDSSGVTHSNFIETTALNLHGDSGGCAFIKDGSSYKIIGQMSGSYHTGSSLTASTFTSSVIGQGCHVGTPFDSTIYRY